MPTPPVSTIHLELPDDFEYACYEEVASRLSPLHESHKLRWIEYATAWTAIPTRFRACVEYDEAFTRSIQINDAPPQPERYYQERDLFSFFVTGLSVIESTCYGLYAIASMLEEGDFPIEKPSQKRAINPENTAKRFCTTFPTAEISRALNKLVNSQDYVDWKEARNILAHRGSPGRTIRLTVGGSGGVHGDALWLNGIPLDTSTTSSRRVWLADALRTLLLETASFTRTKKF